MFLDRGLGENYPVPTPTHQVTAVYIRVVVCCYSMRRLSLIVATAMRVTTRTAVANEVRSLVNRNVGGGGPETFYMINAEGGFITVKSLHVQRRCRHGYNIHQLRYKRIRRYPFVFPSRPVNIYIYIYIYTRI
jgi:hypothetical protein